MGSKSFSISCCWPRLILQRSGALFDVLGDFRKRRAPVGPGKFQAVVFRGIVAGGDVDAAVEFAVNDGVRDGRSGRRAAAQQYAATIGPENGCGRCARNLRRKNAYRSRRSA